MLVYKNLISKKGNPCRALYWQFKSGKLYRLTGIPYSIMEAIIDCEKLNIPCIDEV